MNDKESTLHCLNNMGCHEWQLVIRMTSGGKSCELIFMLSLSLIYLIFSSLCVCLCGVIKSGDLIGGHNHVTVWQYGRFGHKCLRHSALLRLRHPSVTHLRRRLLLFTGERKLLRLPACVYMGILFRYLTRVPWLLALTAQTACFTVAQCYLAV